MERYFAEVVSGKVARVIVAKPEFIATLKGTWIECGGNTGRNRAGKGYSYIPEKNNFASPQPYPSWILDNDCIWQPPILRPNDGNEYIWNEEDLTWEIFEE